MPDLAGPKGKIPYSRDAWGTPRFEVADLDEAAFARGYFHALDRLVQVQLTLAAGRGELMSILGDEPLPRWVDRASRALGLATGLDEEVSKLTPRTRQVIDAYCEGFNAGMRERGRPLITRLLGVTPQPYSPRDVVLILRTACWFGLSSLTETGRIATTQLLEDGASDALMDLLIGPEGATGLDRVVAQGLQWPPADGLPGLAPPGGSNAFAVSGKRSKSGGGLLMSEFHMEVCRFPPIVHISHAQLPDGYLQGAAVPGLPMVSAGRTPHVGWGFTFGHADQIDITVQRVRDGARLVGDAWVPLRRRTETVKIRGAADETWTFLDFDGGTVLSEPSAEEERCFALGWRGLHESHSDLETTLQVFEATSVDELLDTMPRLRMASLAGVFVDAAGRIGWAHSGRVAQNRAGWGPRAGWDLGADPDVPESQRPRRVDPPEGFVASANERTPGWTSFPEARYRHERLTKLLGGDAALGPDDLLRFSYDEHDPCAERLLPVWRDLLPDDPDARALAAWDGSAGHRREMGLFHALHHELTHHVVAEHIGEERSRRMWDDINLIIQFQDRIDDTLALETDHLDREGLRSAIQARWSVALEQVTRKMVNGPVTAPFKNTITQGKLPTWMGFSTSPIELPGGPTSLFASRRNQLLGESMITGPAFHIVIDMSEEGLRYNLPGGASERRRGPGYGSGVEAWRTGELLRLV